MAGGVFGVYRVDLLDGFMSCVAVEDVGRENREEHHAQRRQQHRDDLSDGGYGENLGTDRRDVHPSPPKRIAESHEFRVDAGFIVEEDQR